LVKLLRDCRKHPRPAAFGALKIGRPDGIHLMVERSHAALVGGLENDGDEGAVRSFFLGGRPPGKGKPMRRIDHPVFAPMEGLALRPLVGEGEATADLSIDLDAHHLAGQAGFDQ